MAAILIVDDEPDTITLFSLVVSRLGHEPLTAESGQSALEVIENGTPDVVLLDIMMPEMDGYETLRRIRDLPQGKSVPVLVVTASKDPDLSEKVAAAGGNGYLHKPLGLDALQVLLKDYIKPVELPQLPAKTAGDPADLS